MSLNPGLFTPAVANGQITDRDTELCEMQGRTMWEAGV